MHVGTWTAKETFRSLSLTILKHGHGPLHLTRWIKIKVWIELGYELAGKGPGGRSGSEALFKCNDGDHWPGCRMPLAAYTDNSAETEVRFFRLGAPRSSATGAFRKRCLWSTKLGSWLLIRKKGSRVILIYDIISSRWGARYGGDRPTFEGTWRCEEFTVCLVHFFWV